MKNKRKSKKHSNSFAGAVAVILLLIIGVFILLRKSGSFELPSATVSPVSESPAAESSEPAVPAESQPAAEVSAENTPEPTPEPTPQPDYDIGKLVISEIMSDNKACLRYTDGSFPDWVEIRNVSDEAVDLSGWKLSDGSSNWTFPDVTLGAGEYYVVYAQAGSSDASVAGFGISDGETVSLYTPMENLSDSAVCGDTDADHSWALLETGSFSLCDYPTPGEENTLEGYCRVRSASACTSTLRINEVMTSNSTVLYDSAHDDYPDWIELRNCSDSSMSLGGYYLTDKADDLTRWALPDSSLEAGGKFVFLCTEDYTSSNLGIYVLSGTLDGENDRLYLTDGSKIIDCLSLHNIPRDGSIGRSSDGVTEYYTTPTPGTENEAGFPYVCEKPVSLEADGVFNDVESVTVELSGSGDIYYTLDGSLPTHDSTLYEGPLTLTETTVVRAICSDGIGIDSYARSLSYIINENLTIPVVSITTDDPEQMNTIYRAGTAGKGIELPGNIAFYAEDENFSLDCGVRMAGNGTLDSEQKKGIGVRFRSRYGTDSLDYDLFGGPITSFKALSLRAGGSDWDRAIIRNELAENLALPATDNVLTQHSRYCILYLNGEYYGIYSLIEKIDENYIAEYYDVSKDSVEIVDGPTQGWETVYYEAMQYLYTHDMSVQENYEHFCELFDIDNLIDWLILEGYSGNTDIVWNNIRYYKSTETDGKWRLIFFDLDAAFTYDYYNFLNIFNISTEYNEPVKIMLKLKYNAEFRDKFLTRAGELLSGPLSNENLIAEAEELFSILSPEIERNCERWSLRPALVESSQNQLRNIIQNYNTVSVDTICQWMSVTDEERELYFGDVA